MYQPLKNENGTTLIELVIVAVLIGLLSAMAVPRWLEYLPQMRTKAAAREAVSTLREARSRAISQKVPYGVYFDTENGECVMFCDTDAPGDNLYVEGDSTIMTRKMAHDVQMGYTTFDGNVVFFQPSGEASNTGSVTLTSENYRTMLVIDILAGTGKVKLSERETSAETQ
jgi:Tfp pilus assembly protein FimT